MSFVNIGDEDATEGLSKAIYDQLDSRLAQVAEDDDATKETLSELERVLKDVSYTVAKEIGDDVNDELSFLRDEMVNLIDGLSQAQPTPQDGGTALKAQTIAQWNTIKSRLQNR